jgi:hypothetical protein
MTGSKTPVTVADLRLTLIGLEDWLHEIRTELQALPETTVIAEVDPHAVPSPPADPLASVDDPEVVHFVRASGPTVGCVPGLPEIGPAFFAGKCRQLSLSRTAVRAQHLTRALARIGWLAQVCSYLFAQMPPDQVIRPEIK